MPYGKIVKLPSLALVVCVLAGCSITNKTQVDYDESATHSEATVEFNHQLSNVADGKSKNALAVNVDSPQRDESQVKQDKFKYSINGEIFFSNMTELLPGVKVIDRALIGWKITPSLTISFERPKALDNHWTDWLDDYSPTYTTRDNIHHQITLKSAAKLDMYKVYQQAKSMPGVKQVELGLFALPRRDRGAQAY